MAKRISKKTEKASTSNTVYRLNRGVADPKPQAGTPLGSKQIVDITTDSSGKVTSTNIPVNP